MHMEPQKQNPKNNKNNVEIITFLDQHKFLKDQFSLPNEGTKTKKSYDSIYNHTMILKTKQRNN